MVVDLDTDYQVGMPELRIIPDRARAADLGVPVENVATTINALVGGLRVGKYSAAAAASTCGSGCSPTSGRARRTSQRLHVRSGLGRPHARSPRW
jgi:multidrug efflux pump subunit AcrB